MCVGLAEALGSSALDPLGGILAGRFPSLPSWGSILSVPSLPLPFLSAEVKMGKFQMKGKLSLDEP